MTLTDITINKTPISDSALLSHISRGGALVTANNRLARACERLYDQHQQSQQLAVWPSADILPWGAWLEREWEQLLLSVDALADRRLLSPAQLRLLWATVIQRSEAATHLMRIQPAARLAQDAARLLTEWRLEPTDEDFRWLPDHQAFAGWYRATAEQCRQQGWIGTDAIAGLLIDALESGDYAPEQDLLFYGFESLTPLQQNLLQALQGAGRAVQWAMPQAGAAEAVRVACADANDEMQTLARWLRQKMQQQPDVSIGIVVPDLTERRQSLVNALDRLLVPASLSPDDENDQRPYNLSMGLPLTEFAVVRSAMQCLSLLQPRIPIEILSSLLRSPYLAGWQEEADARAQLDRRLRDNREADIRLRELQYFAAQTDRSWSCPQLTQQLIRVQGFIRDCPGQAKPSAWGRLLAQFMQAIGWPGGRALNSEEYQAVEDWKQQLAQLSALDIVAGSMTRDEALAQLRQLCHERTFQASSDYRPVQVLGLYEAIGLQFDALWIMGMHDQAWPPPLRPNPLIPQALLKRRDMPHSSVAHELARARSITQDLLTAAPEVVASYALSGESAEEQTPSPLIRHLPMADSDALLQGQSDDWRQHVFASAGSQALETDPAPPLTDLPQQVRGGARLFELQAACPFRAFAELRLHAQPFGITEVGLDALDRGTLVHRVLEQFWNDIQDQQTLQALTTEQLTTRLVEKVRAAIAELTRQSAMSVDERFWQIEEHRLTELLGIWLEKEAGRQAFTVQACEQQQQLRLADIEISLKIDRIDRLDDGRLVIIDYKTGKVHASDWFGERPDSPQLPLYAIALEGDIAAVLFAQIRIDDSRFQGVVSDEGIIEGLPGRTPQLKAVMQDWSGQFAQWRETLTELATEFRDGIADVRPKDLARSCRYCDLHSLCRIHEIESPGMDEGEVT